MGLDHYFGASPDIVPFAVGLAISHEASAGLVQVLAAVRTLQAGCMPLQVWGHLQDVLIVDLAPAAHTHGNPGLFYGKRRGHLKRI